MSNPSTPLSADPSATGDSERMQRFERLALPHLDAAYNLARWMTRNDDDARDVVQEALMRAMRRVHDPRVESARAWWLQIVRHTCLSWLKENRCGDRVLVDDVEAAWPGATAPPSEEPPAIAAREAGKAQINAAIAGLPVLYREVLVLRELEDLSYREIARIVDIPIGTVMSRLSRARDLMRVALTRPPTPEPGGGKRRSEARMAQAVPAMTP